MSRLRIAVAVTLATVSTSYAAKDSRELVNMPVPIVRHMLDNMRDHLLAISEMQRFLSRGELQRDSDVAEQRLGLSSLEAHGGSHMAPFMPKPMQDIGALMHKAASQFALVAQDSSADGNVLRALGALSEVTSHCVACHSSYRVH